MQASHISHSIILTEEVPMAHEQRHILEKSKDRLRYKVRISEFVETSNSSPTPFSHRNSLGITFSLSTNDLDKGIVDL